jgi:hypothetical protein
MRDGRIELVGRSCPVGRGFPAVCFVSLSRLVSSLESPDFQRLRVATAITSECAVSSKRLVCVTSVSREASEYQTNGMRTQCRSGGGGVVVC